MFFFHPIQKPVIVTIHGFGKRLHTEFDPFAAYFEKRRYTVIQFDIYDLNNPNDADPQVWIERCEKKLLEVTKQYEHVIVIGFSMGGVIASYLASIFTIDQLILVAPAFEYISAHTVLEYGVKAVKNIYQNQPQKEEKPSSKQTSAFTEIVNTYRESIASVNCPVLLLHGLKDEVIPLSSSRNAYQKIKGKHRLICFEDGKHRMLYDNTIQETIFPIIELMITNRLM
ncbi:alpha/beta hydrolase [Absicoccus intestinalis]|uniref:Alpha/beta hydrolase n=1 Tax=Absicoccus intestinalis TaxID=2926319 RepID=A0ABU4WK60_9FIRM|nr:YqiA/YcfP family alpha/beta fold hydrolase [Absicoccus sp. CLA-KB-P134]MDX8416931.1 alpha/beta hydrolase [Absicoccus sp. CLA-KB-P134]